MSRKINPELKAKITQAFKNLRKQGIIAIQNVPQEDNNNIVATRLQEARDTGKSYRGFAYLVSWHVGYPNHNRMYTNLCYGNDLCGSFQEKPTKEIGQLVAKELDRCGVPYEWDGNPAYAITLWTEDWTKE